MSTVVQPEILAEYTDETYARRRWVENLYVAGLESAHAPRAAVPISDEMLWGVKIERPLQTFDIGSGAAILENCVPSVWDAA